MAIHYIQKSMPRKDELGDLVKKAIGASSTLDFAEAVRRNAPNAKVSAATISRLCTGSYKKAPDAELLEGIALAADKSSGVTFDALMRASGMMPAEEATKDDGMRSRMIRRRMLRDSIVTLMHEEISKRGYMSSALFNSRTEELAEMDSLLFTRGYSFGFRVSGMAPCSVWKFGVDYETFEEAEQEESDEVKLKAAMMVNTRFFDQCGSVFAGDAFEPERFENEKYSFVFIDKLLYKAFVEKLKDIQVNGFMTVILIDIDNMEVIEETQLARQDGATRISFFKEPVVQRFDDTSDSDFNPDDF